MSICISVPYCKGVKSDTCLTKPERGEQFGGGTGEGTVWGKKVSKSPDEKPGKPFQDLLYRNCLYSFPFQSNTNRPSDLTVHCLVKGQRGSTLTGLLSFNMQVENNRKKGSFSLVFACHSLTPVTGEKCSLLDQVSWEGLEFNPLPNLLATWTRSFIRASGQEARSSF